MAATTETAEARRPGGRRPAGPAAAALRRRFGRGADPLAHPFLSLPAVGVVAVGFLLPLAVLVVYSFWPTEGGEVVREWTLSNYTRIFSESAYWSSLLRSFLFVGLASLLTVALAFPFAYFVATKVKPSRRLLWILLATIPFWTSYLIRVFAWLNLLGDGGIINDALVGIGLIDAPLGLLAPGKPAVVITFVYLLFPLTFLTTYIALERTDPALLTAAADLGARPWQGLLRVTLPLAKTGLIGGFVFAFIAMMGDYVTPGLIGGTEGTLYANLIVNQFGNSVQWGFGASLALVLLGSVFLMLVVLRMSAGAGDEAGEFTRTFVPRRAPLLRAYALLFLVYLYLPVAVLVVFAVNDAETVGFPFEGFTLRWFEAVSENAILLDALWLSLRVAAISVGISVVLGTLAAVQFARSRGTLRSLSLATIAMPLFLPPVVLGLAIIIGLNFAGVERGEWTIIAGHTVLALPIVTLLVLVRLEGLDKNQELAAMDLGASPLRALIWIVVPQAIPGIVAAALIAFAISLDEFIMTFLITGSQTTLPLYVYGSLRFGISPELNAISAMILGLSFLLLSLGALIVTRRDRGARGGATVAERARLG